MSERSSSVMVGAFVVGSLVIAIAGALFFAGGGLGGSDRSKVVMVFDGSLRGLNVGAPVALRGVTIGQVTEIDLLLNTDQGEVTMSVVAQIDPSTMQLSGSATENINEELVARGLRAQLNTQSLLTGLLYVQLDFHPDTEATYAEIDSPYPQIPTIPTELEQLRKSLESIDYGAIAANVDRIATGMDKLLNNPDMQALPGAMRNSFAAIESTSQALSSTLADNSEQLSALLESSSATMDEFSKQLPAISTAITSSLAELDAALKAAGGSLARLEEAAAPDSAPRRQLSQTMHELSLAARALRSLARSLDEHPESLLRGRSGDSE
ncbi:MAG: hypothetical protein Cons2KO_22850 [Congregibacter sp.]